MAKSLAAKRIRTKAAKMNGIDIVQGFIARGYSPFQAAALAGHAVQESGGDPTSINKGEDAHGILQWRGDRWQGLQDFAKSQGKSPNDPGVQMDYVGREMAGPENRNSQGFLNSTDVNSASAALKPYIRFGDNSDATRRGNAVGLLDLFNGQGGSSPPQVGALTPAQAYAAAAPAPGAEGPTAPIAVPGQPAPASPWDSFGKSVAGLAKIGAPPPAGTFAPLQQINMPQANAGRSQQIAQALSQLYRGNGQ